jgi:hypothetical protein
VTSIQIMKIEETGRDYVLLRDSKMEVRVNFEDDEMFTKEDSAGFFRGLVGKPAAIESPDSNGVNGQFFIAVDFWRDVDDHLKVVPFTFAISTVEVSV